MFYSGVTTRFGDSVLIIWDEIDNFDLEAYELGDKVMRSIRKQERGY